MGSSPPRCTWSGAKCETVSMPVFCQPGGRLAHWPLAAQNRSGSGPLCQDLLPSSLFKPAGGQGGPLPLEWTCSSGCPWLSPLPQPLAAREGPAVPATSQLAVGELVPSRVRDGGLSSKLCTQPFPSR